ncbi:MarR family winged helix-turn-helix transcriptional regulator [Pararhodobacter zhoushanensis]|uniref:MarR family winged helix-turn-helix transcriptional regulator n=1 Tax=Pararhodobacter zhoushanensis TaxID=2479545 RepID=A0ABT3GV88_9RHOB|nr:MarR family winged helix-turn-helix transcriptional regulator [Pararhodobacter zhoushanensis]MCW1931419.1 MarR family winged helix-turn-helix transcriptional regulator [Pararhodobacter zhoushanensis]
MNATAKADTLLAALTQEPVDAEAQRIAATLDTFYTRPGYMIRRAHQISNASFVEDLGSLGITPTQMSSLVVVCDCPGIDQITLARRIGVDRTTASMVVNGLAQHGFLRCERSARDARRNEVTATRAGMACTQLARDFAMTNKGKLLHAFTPQDEATLQSLLKRLIDTVPASPPEWIRPDGTVQFGTEDAFAEDFPGHFGLYTAFGFLLRRAHQTLEAAFIDCCQPVNLTPRRYGVLRVVEVAEPLEQIALARWLALDGSTAASVVTELVRRGHLDRTPHPSDRRRRLLQLTDEGRTLVETALPLAREASLRALAVLGDDAAEFGRLMQLFLVSNDSLSRVASERAVTQRAAQFLQDGLAPSADPR